MSAMRIDQTDWSLSDGTISKSCSYTGLLGDDRQHILLIEIPTSRSHVTGLLEPGFRLIVEPDPLPDVEAGPLEGQLVIPSTPFDPAPAPVMVNHEQGDTLVISTASTQDAESFVQTVSSGEDMRFVLLSGNEPLIELPIPNDADVVKILREALD